MTMSMKLINLCGQTFTLRRGGWKGSCVATLILACLATSHASAETRHWTGAVDTNWFTAGNWEPAGPPQADDTVIVDAGTSVWLTNATPPLALFELDVGKTLTISGWESALEARELTIAGTVTHTVNMTSTTNSLGEWVPEHRVLIRGSNLTITVAGRIDTDACGYRGGGDGPGYGPGRGLYAGNRYGGGAAHGGLSGNSYGGADGGPIYGSVENPWQPGSGGGNNGGDGGGTVRFELSGHMQIDGEIRASAGNGTSGWYGGGSGGSIAVDCRTFAGAGWLRANGSGGSVNGGSGGGGRISCHFDGPQQTLLGTVALGFEVMGSASGKWFHTEAWRDYAMGTIYLSNSDFLSHGWPTWNGWLHLPTNRLDVVGDLTLASRNAAFATIRRVDIGGNLTLANGGKLFLVGEPTATPTLPGAELNVVGDMLIQSGGVLYPRSHPTNGASLRIKAANLTVNTGGAIDATGRGYRGGSIRPADDPDGATGQSYGPSQPTIGFVASSGAIYGGGASYGGLGGDGYAGTLRGLRYGTPDTVVEPGSGGAGHSAGGGGGLIWIEVDGHARIDGELRVNGDSNAISGQLGSGGGSGGGVSITSRTLGGAGRILSNGGNGTNGGVGGGGRIALHYDPLYQADVAPPALYCELLSGVAGFTLRSATPNEIRQGTLWVPDILLIGTNWNNVTGWLYLPTNRIHIAGNLSVTGGWATLGTGQMLEVDGDLVVGGSGSLSLDPLPTTALSIPGARIDVGGELVVNSGGTLYFRSHPTNGAPLKVTARNVTVAAGGLICGDERGYFGQEDPWPAYGPGAGIQSGSTTHGSGAGYGGAGGYGYWGKPGGTAYGLALAPLEPGSGGGGYYYGGHGGATVWIETPGQLRVDGEIRSNGGLCRGSYNGGGSGGGILLNARTIVGSPTGIIRADGAAGNVYGGGGAGGRIACWRRIPSGLAAQLIAGEVTNLVQDAVATTYQGTTSAIGGTGYTSYTGELDYNKAGDGTVVWLSTHGTVLLIH